ncbi:MAG: hypothetical protein ACUVRD_07685 [Bacteroidia bacterium]
MMYFLRRRAAKILALSFLTGCDSTVIDHSFSQRRWVYPDTLTGSWQETGGCRELFITLQMTPDYPYRNLWVKFFLFSDGRPLSESLAEFVFEDAYGKPYASNYRLERLLVHWDNLPKGNYLLKILPFTRQDTVVGIRFMRLWIKPCQK